MYLIFTLPVFKVVHRAKLTVMVTSIPKIRQCRWNTTMLPVALHTRPCSSVNRAWFHCNNLQPRNCLPERKLLVKMNANFATKSLLPVLVE